MGLHLYCITPPAHQPPDGTTGVEGSPVRALAAGPIALWVSAHDTRPAADVGAVREHNAAIVAALTSEVTPVPARYGQYFTDEGAAREAIGTSQEKWVVLLDRFAGAVEYGLRVFDPARNEPGEGAAATPSGAGTGTRYMEALAARAQDSGATAAGVSNALRAAVAGVVLDTRMEPLRTPHGVLTVAHLVHASAVDAYRTAIESVRQSRPRLRLLSTGPWVPYSFVE